MRKLVKWIVIGVIGLVLLASCVAAVAGVDEPEPKSKGGGSFADGTHDKVGDKLEPAQDDPRPTPPPAPEFTSGEENAIAAAENYVDLMGFSREGLIEQLEFEGYPARDAEIAVDTLDPDWNQEAVEAAEQYLDTMPFSEAGLVDQLEFDGFTPGQARFGARAAG